MSDIKEQVQGIIDTLENPPTLCRDCGWTYHDEDGELAACPECDSEDYAELSAFDYLQDALDIEYVIGSDRQFLGARVLVCFGGPNVWVDTRHSRVDGHWWSESCIEPFYDTMGLKEALEELWECGQC
jgi:hypothetical protein